jgi:hypothetical protein
MNLFGRKSDSRNRPEIPSVQELTGGMGGLAMGREEPECIKQWKIEQQQMLKQKDADEEDKKDELREKAAQELADWHKNYEEQLTKTRKVNGKLDFLKYKSDL